MATGSQSDVYNWNDQMSDYFHWHMNMFKYAMNYITVEKDKYY